MKKILLILIILLNNSCLFSKKIILVSKENIKLEEVEFSELEGWGNDDHKMALQSFLHSCRKFAKMAEESSIGGKIGNIKVKDFRDVCEISEALKTLNAKQAKNFFENWFKPFLIYSNNGHGNGLFTGYYEASLNGSFTKSDKYKYPIYGKPKNLNENPMITRQEIENGALENQGLEIIYVDDKVELFFMHIQGSGRVRLDDGREVRISFAGKNKQPFVAISNQMYEKKLIEKNKLNSAGVREWLKQNPEQADEIMNINPSYTFFKISQQDYVIGSQGVPLTQERSLAVDNEFIPYGLPIWLNTSLTARNGTKAPYSRLLVSQDTGSAIKGVIRGDIFFGYGKEAEEKAFYMASKGNYYVLLPINLIDRLRNIPN